jgi:hypothetical protein
LFNLLCFALAVCLRTLVLSPDIIDNTLQEISLRRLAAILLLICATTHCILSIFYVNTSYLDLHRYAQGLEREPFQRRFLMVPILHWAEDDHLLQAAAARYGVNVPQPEPMSSAKLACVVLSLIFLNAFGLWTIRASRQLGIRHWWLLWALLLAILYASYGARYEQPLWYPYDVPHLILFGLVTIFILADRPLPFVAAFAIDAPLRETSIFLIALAFFVHMRSKAWRIAITACSVLWVIVRLVAMRLYPNGAHAWNGLHWYNQIKPWHLPQLFSIVGFFWLPVWLGIRYLHSRERIALYAASAMIFLTFFFATWNETRAWSEWTVLFAVLAALQLERSFAASLPPAA